MSLGNRAGIGQKGCRECSKPIPPGALFCGGSCRSKHTIRKTGDRNRKALERARAKMAECRKEGFRKPRKSEQTRELEAFYKSVRDWYWAEVEKYADHYSRLGVPAVREVGSTVCGMFPNGGCWGALTHDHVSNRTVKDPAESQTLCMGHQGTKGSSKGSGWDFRVERFKAWLIEARNRDWEYKTLGVNLGTWEKKTKEIQPRTGGRE